MKLSYDKLVHRQPLRVYCLDEGPLTKGTAVCYERAYSTPKEGELTIDPTAKRDNYVRVASSTNNNSFAGILISSYPASLNGQWIEVDVPGTVSEVFCPVATTVNSTLLTALTNAAPGVFVLPGLSGCGSVIALQTQNNVTSKDAVVGPVCSSLGNFANCTAATNTLTMAGAFTHAKAGDKVIILSGLTATGGQCVINGTYTIREVVDTGNVVLCRNFCVANGTVLFVCYRGTPMVMAEVLDGPQSGLVEVVSPVQGSAPAIQVGGTTYLYTRVSNGLAADYSITVNNPYRGIQHKNFILMGLIDTTGTQRHVVILPNNDNIVRPTHANLTNFKMFRDKDCCTLTWNGAAWLLQGRGTAT